jgi:tetratricopeptide (TPR) repeat protein
MKTIAPYLTLALLLLLQSQLGQVKGGLLDMRGKPIADAPVFYTNVDSQRIYKAKTDANGSFLIVGVVAGVYEVRVNRPDGGQIYYARKQVYASDNDAANVIQIDLSLVPTKASLAPFFGTKAEEMQKQEWRSAPDLPLNLTADQREELRKENALIADYNFLTPQAQQAIQAQDWPQAATLLQQLIKIAPYKWELYQNLGNIQRRRTHFQEAVQTLEQGIKVLAEGPDQRQDPKQAKSSTAQMRIEEGEAYVAMGNPEGAVTQFRAAVQLNPKSALAFLHLCTAEYNNGHPDQAVIACNQAIKLEPSHSENYQVLAGIQSNLEHYEDALATYQKGIAAAQANLAGVPPSPEADSTSPKNSDSSQSSPEAARAGQMLQSAGNIYFHMKNYPKAVDFFTQSAQLHPYPASPLFNLCATLFDMKNLAAAAAACDKAIQIDPKMPDPYYVKAAALYADAAKQGKTNDSNEGKAALEKYLQLAPEGFYAEKARGMLKEVNGQ